jgi:hypothetical protein
VLNLPWGSLFTAILLPRLKQERPHADKVRPFSTYLSWTVLHDLAWGLRAASWIIRFALETILFKSRYQLLGGVGATWQLLSEITIYPNYDKVAFGILDSKPEVHAVIFGHTHILRYRQWREGKEYFNEGTWNEVTSLDLAEYGTRTRLTYAFVEYPDQGPGANPSDWRGRPKVRLKEWKGVWRPESEILV